MTNAHGVVHPPALQVLALHAFVDDLALQIGDGGLQRARVGVLHVGRQLLVLPIVAVHVLRLLLNLVVAPPDLHLVLLNRLALPKRDRDLMSMPIYVFVK
jgi:hypothetical protein